MQVATTLDPTLWKPSLESRAIFAALGDGNVFFVGGRVRNCLLGRPLGDADMATIHHPDEVTRKLEAEGIKVIPSGIEHGTVTAVINGNPFEITTLRRDVETDGRHAVVSFTKDWAEDAQRRDFTMNTLLADLEGHVYDPTGRGLADLMAGKVVFVGNPAQRIAEDHLRILRFFRFQALYGRGDPDESALAACRAAADKVKTLSKERVTQETLKILSIDNPAPILGVMRDNRVMAELFHPDFYTDALNTLCLLQKSVGQALVEARIAVLCFGAAEHMAIIQKYLFLSNAQKRALESLFRAFEAPSGLKEKLYRFGREIGGQSALVLAALGGIKIDDDTLGIIKNWPIPVFPLTGEDALAAGLSPGPELGASLRRVEDWWVASGFVGGREDCLKKLHEEIT